MSGEPESQRIEGRGIEGRGVEALLDAFDAASAGEREAARALFRAAAALREHPRSSAAREARLVRRTLAATTRLDGGWRGDLRLVGAFVQRRVARSPLLRLAAASLLIHVLVVGPLLAFWALHPAPKPHFTTGIVYPERGLEDPADEPAPPLEAGRDLDAQRFDRIENARRLHRYAYGHAPELPQAWRAPLDLSDLGTPPAALGRLLRLRAQAMAAGRFPHGFESALATRFGGAADASVALRDLRALLLLDQALLEGRRALELGAALNTLALAEREAPERLGPLGRLVLERARATGEWGASDEAALPADAPQAERLAPLGDAETSALQSELPADLPELADWSTWLRGR